MGQLNQRSDVEVDHLHFAIEDRLGERPATAKAGVVDQEVDALFSARRRSAMLLARPRRTGRRR
jgi:hypothetical protein